MHEKANRARTGYTGFAVIFDVIDTTQRYRYLCLEAVSAYQHQYRSLLAVHCHCEASFMHAIWNKSSDRPHQAVWSYDTNNG